MSYRVERGREACKRMDKEWIWNITFLLNITFPNSNFFIWFDNKTVRIDNDYVFKFILIS